MSLKVSVNKWIFRFAGGFIAWLFAIALGLIALKGNMQGFGSRAWLYQTGAVYLLWGFLNYLIFFTIVYFIIPQWVKNRKYGMMILYTLLVILVVGLLKYYFVSLNRFEYVRVSYYKDEAGNEPVYFTFLQYMQKILFTGTFVSLLAYGFGLTINWFKGEKQRKTLEAKQVEAELSFLRMQVSPHFLFNTLNSIYSLSLKKSDDAPQAVLKLADMMRYMIYEEEDEHHRVDLVKEIDYIKNYIELQQIRFKHNLHVNFFHEGDIENKKIVPLLLITFVENGFKHGVLDDVANPLTINLVVEGEKLVLVVKDKKNLDSTYYSGGIGLDNVKRRLELSYPGRHQVTIREEGGFYHSELIVLLQ